MTSVFRRASRKFISRSSLLLLVPALLSCTDLAYYTQSVKGHLDIVSQRRPVQDLLGDPDTPEELRRRLLFSNEVLAFARNTLHLDVEGSYQHYADIGREFVVWNVVATPALSLTPRTWCFPVAGCVPYRGYFRQADAISFAETLESQQGLDTHVYGVTAYSTLGWFDDPLLNTFLFENELRLVELLLHELAHKKFYIEDDSDFNEAFAVVVAQKGVDVWLQEHPGAAALAELQLTRSRQDQFFNVFDATRAELAQLYASDLPDQKKLQRKEAVFERFRAQYQALLEGWQIKPEGGWLEGRLNNARFASVTTYRRLVPPLAKLWDASPRGAAGFYEVVEELAALDKSTRHRRLLDKLATSYQE